MRLYRIAAGAALFSLASLSPAQSYKIVDHWKVGGTGGWDYLQSDDAAHRLYIAHNARVEVLDTATGKPVGAITGLKSTHGIALNPNGKNGYISDGAGNAIIIFDRATLSITQTVPAGTNPDGITYEPKTNTVWAFNGRSKDVSVLDASTNQVVATIPLPGKPEFPQVDSNGNVFVNIEDKNSIVQLDAREKSITATWNLTGCESPSGMAIDKAGKRLFSVCGGNKMSVLDYSSGKLLGLASIGDSPDAAGFDPKTGYVFSSNGGDGTLTVINTNQPGFPQVQSLATALGAKTMAFDASTGKIYLGAAKYAPPAAPTAAIPKPRPAILPDSFEVIVVSR